MGLGANKIFHLCVRSNNDSDEKFPSSPIFRYDVHLKVSRIDKYSCRPVETVGFISEFVLFYKTGGQYP